MNAVLFFKRYAYLALSGLLVIFQALCINKGHWIGDFWDHAAVLNELFRNPFIPQNPIISSGTPHAFFSPYSLFVALIGRILNLTPFYALTYFGVLNLLLFLWGLYYFCRKIAPEKTSIFPVLALLFVLLFWGANAPSWSGFYHLNTLHYILPYPATFSMAVCFFVTGAIIERKVRKTWNHVLHILLITIVMLTHPLTAFILFVAMAMLNVFYLKLSFQQAVLDFLLLVAPAFILCLVWPYYNFLDLYSGNAADFHLDSLELYQNVWQRMWPALASILLITIIKRDKLAQFFCATILLLLIVYVSGYVLNIYGLSRVIAGVMMFTQIGLAYFVCTISTLSTKSLRYPGLIVGCLFFVSLFVNRYYLYHTITYPGLVIKTAHERFNFLTFTIGPNDVVLTDLTSAQYVPAYNGKVIATIKPLYWVPDIVQRRLAIQRFFSTETSNEVRDSVINYYKPQYLLVDSLWNSPYLQRLRSSTTTDTVYNKDGLILLKIKYGE